MTLILTPKHHAPDRRSFRSIFNHHLSPIVSDHRVGLSLASYAQERPFIVVQGEPELKARRLLLGIW